MEKDLVLSETVNQLKRAVDRYTSAEEMILEYLKAPWWKRIFFYKKFLVFSFKQLYDLK